MSLDILALDRTMAESQIEVEMARGSFSALADAIPGPIHTGISQLVGDKDQDRYVAGTPRELVPKYLAVFDGHGKTALAADMCAEGLYDLILDIDKEKNPSIDSSTMVPSDDAIIQSFHQMHDDIVKKAFAQEQPRTGTCALCLFLGEPTEQDVDALNSDDSEVFTLDSGEAEEVAVDEDEEVVSFAKVAWAGDSKCVLVDSHHNVTELTEDHRVETNEREVKRIEELALSTAPREGLKESEFWQSELEKSEKTGVQPRPKSFVGQRSYNNVPLGKKVLFSYTNGISLQISRTLGDPLAARSATPEPEISKVRIKNGEYCRFVLATDGVWDVFTPKEVASVLKKYPDPKKAGRVISYQAKNKRAAKGLNNDDITTLIVEVNVHNKAQHKKNKGIFPLFGKK